MFLPKWDAPDKLFRDPVEFTKWVADTRNYLTHLDRHKKRRIAKDDSLEIMIYSLIWLLRIHFLIEIGFSVEQCESLLNGNTEYKALCDDPDLNSPWRNIEGKNIISIAEDLNLKNKSN